MDFIETERISIEYLKQVLTSLVKKNENKNPLKVILEMEKENELAIKVEGIENSDQIIPTTNNLFKQGLEPLKFHCSNLSLINPKKKLKLTLVVIENRISNSFSFQYLYGDTIEEGFQQLFRPQIIESVIWKQKNNESKIEAYVGLNSLKRVPFKQEETYNLHCLGFNNLIPMTEITIKIMFSNLLSNFQWSDFGIEISKNYTPQIVGNSGACLFSSSQEKLVNIVILINVTSISEDSIQIPFILKKVMKKLNISSPEIIVSEKELQKKRIIEKCIPELCESINGIVNRSQNSAFKNQVLSILKIASTNEIPDKLTLLFKENLLNEQISQPKKRKKTNSDEK